jgi:endonuclease III
MTTSRKKPAPDGAVKTRIKKIIGTLERVHPDAKLDLDFTNPLELLIALMLAAQARDDLVNKVTGDLFKEHRSAADYAATPLPLLQQRIGKINFYRNKAKALHNCCKELVERFGGKVPHTLDDLISLPGVGRKTANIVLGNAFGQQAIGVDTHVMRQDRRRQDRSGPDESGPGKTTRPFLSLAAVSWQASLHRQETQVLGVRDPSMVSVPRQESLASTPPPLPSLGR